MWKATADLGSFNLIVRTLVLTGQRLEEVASMAWDELSPDLSTWTIPAARAKNGRAHRSALLSGSDHTPGGSAHGERPPRGRVLVFPGEQGVYSGWSKSTERLDRRSGVSQWALHDLRRTMATGLQKLGVRLEVTEAVLNHLSGALAS